MQPFGEIARFVPLDGRLAKKLDSLAFYFGAFNPKKHRSWSVSPLTIIINPTHSFDCLVLN